MNSDTRELVLKEIEWGEIYPIWASKLWPGRPKIKSYTPMINATDIDKKIHRYANDNFAYYSGVFFGIKDLQNGKVVACNSGHQCSNTLFRSRGLYVFPKYTGKGLAQLLLQHTINFARKKGFKKIWSYPRDKAIPTYKAVGYTVGETHEHEAYTKEDGSVLVRPNAYAELIL
jgi:GNAT superfamily N-acetyltransferase